MASVKEEVQNVLQKYRLKNKNLRKENECLEELNNKLTDTISLKKDENE